ncbi:MAG: hypothetical protein CML04_03390 [Pseudozobellia sp.]|nr:hypothetical protein [Pseudozobellia sp.]MBG49189.1 hypothetical protein [Pseudozobellia sp.]|tara:strand:+ start:1486703 stop:1487836 length:1134 start_codon:yes stop_codon:yes gene_type:complete
MKIQIDGTNTLNKGAELMLCAILERIEHQYPKSTVYYNANEIEKEVPVLPYQVNLKKRLPLHYGRIPSGILRRLNLPYTYFTSKYAAKNIDLVLDGAGFQFSDQWKYTDERLNTLDAYYSKLKANKSKIVFLPQALGPFETENGKRAVQIINKYADVIIAREKISYEYVLNAGANEKKVWLYPDFTALVNGVVPNYYQDLDRQVCIIPNKKMVTHAGNNSEKYIVFLEDIVRYLKNIGERVFLLNHEGPGDLELCKRLNLLFNNELTVVNGLRAKEVKGVIGISKMVISSRFHGVASALTQGVPCLATSWNHKYKMLFKDFDQFDNVLSFDNDRESELKRISEVLTNIAPISDVLEKKKQEVKKLNFEMWDKIWALM